MATSENVKGIQIQIGGDTTPLYNALNEASKKTKELESDLVALNKSLKTDPKNVELLQKKFDTLGGIVESCTKEVDILRKGLSSAEMKFRNGEITEEQFKEIAKSTDQAEKKLKYYQEQFDNFKDSEAKLIDVREEIDKLAKEHDDLSTAFGEYTTQLSNTDYQTQPEKWQEIKQKVDDTRDALEQNNQQMDEAVGKANAIKQEMEQASSGMQTFADASKDASGGMGDFGSEEATFEGTLAKLQNGLSLTSLGFAAMNEAVKLVSKVMQEAMKEIQKWLENLDGVDVATKQLAKDTEQYLKNLDKSTRANKNEVAVLDARFRSINKLNDEILEGNRYGKDTSKLQQQMAREVKALNDAVGSEVLTINKQTGALQQNRTELNHIREAVLAYAEAQYELDKIMELVAKKHELEEQIAGRTYQNYAGGLAKLKEQLAEVETQLGTHTEAYEKANDKLYEFNDVTEKLTGNEAELSKAMENTSKAGIESAIELYEKEQEYQKKRFDVIVETDEKIKEQSETSLKERVEIMRHNAEVMLRYEDNLNTLRELMQTTTDQNLKDELGNYLNYLSNNFTEENLQILNDLVEDFGEKGGETAREYLKFFNSENLPDDMKSAGTEMMNSFNQGIVNGESKVLQTASNLASKIADKLKIKVGISASSSAINFNPSRMAQGGIVTKPTNVLVGEMGSEVIMPLDKLAGIITATMQQSGGSVGNYTMNVYPQSMSPSEQETLFDKFDQRFGASTSRRNI